MVVETLRARPKLVVVLALLAVGAGLLLGFASKAIAADYFHTYTFTLDATFGRTTPIDGDKRVPEYYAVVEDRDGRMIIGMAYQQLDGSAGWKRWIHYDKRQMNNVCATSGEWNDLFRHERAHTRGWSHGEGNPDVNGAYRSVINLAGC